MQGVYRTTVGYAGGKEDNPNYGNIRDYSEAVRVEFNPQEISYQQLLDVFWKSHRPTSRVFLRQYRNAIFYLSEEQRVIAEESRRRIEKEKKRPVLTSIEKAGRFYRGEAYHQKYYLRRMTDLVDDLMQIYPNDEQFVASTSAARINGYLGCHGTPEGLKNDLELLGLSEAGQVKLSNYVVTACREFVGHGCTISLEK